MIVGYQARFGCPLTSIGLDWSAKSVKDEIWLSIPVTGIYERCSLHALAESPSITDHDEPSDLTKGLFAVLNGVAEVSRASSLAWVH